MKKISTRKIFIIIGLLVLADQITKFLVLKQILHSVPLFVHFEDITQDPILIQYVFPFFNIVLAFNKGISFSMLANFQTDFISYVLLALTLIIAGFLIYYMLKKETDYYNKIFLAFIVGGAFGNIVDRIRFAAVVDFLDFHITALNFYWPAFNLADSFVSVGAFLWIFRSILISKKS